MTDQNPQDPKLAALIEVDEAWNNAYHLGEPELLEPMVARDWMGFTPDGVTVQREHLLGSMSQLPPAPLMFERHASQVFGETGITRGTLYVEGQRVQSFLRVYAWHEGGWLALSAQLTA